MQKDCLTIHRNWLQPVTSKATTPYFAQESDADKLYIVVAGKHIAVGLGPVA